MILTARFVAPMDGPVIERGAVSIRDGKIREMGCATDLRRGAHECVDFGNAVITPGFVNAHTHLELTHLAGRVPPTSDFTDWLARLVRVGVEFPPAKESVTQAVTLGLSQSLRAGVTTIGDITRSPAWTREALSRSLIRSVSFGEVIAIGTRRHLLNEKLGAALCTDYESQRLRCGVSPHAPYTVEPDALRECARACASSNLPVCIHTSETREEAEFTRDGTGPLSACLRELGVWDDEIPSAGVGPIELLGACGLLNDRTVLAHANYVSDEDINRIARSGASVAFCPRTHAAFEHPRHRFADMLDAGVNVCLGTDSLASNPSLSILDELRFLHRNHPKVDRSLLLRLGTIHGAKALGLESVVGSIAPGKDADLVAIPLSRGSDWREMLESDVEPVAVLSRGSFAFG